MILKAICGVVALTLIYLTLRHRNRRERRNMTAYLILTIGSADVLVALPDGTEWPDAVHDWTMSI